MPQKIRKYGQEPVAFYLHKKRNFIDKIASQQKQDQAEQIRKEKERELIREN